MALIEVRDFSYSYPGETKPILKDLTWSVEKNSFITLSGKTGCGKSTLGKALAGFLFQDEKPNYSGEIIVNGTNMAQVPLYEASGRVAYVQQNPEDQFCTLSVVDEIAFGLENRCLPPQEIELRIQEALSDVSGLSLINRTLSNLSGGEKQKIAIASILALSPHVLILDEPTSNLDPVATQEIFKTLNALRKKRDLTVIIIEHKFAQLKPLDPKFYILEQGRIKPHRFSQFNQKNQNYLVQPSLTLMQQDFKPAKPIIKMSQAGVKRGEKHVLHNLDLEILPGEFAAIMGPNGSGKSTLLLALMGLIPIHTGTCEIINESIKNKRTSEMVRDVGFIFQNPDHQIFTNTVWDEATLTLKNLKSLSKDKEAQTKELLEQFGLAHKLSDHPQRLSYGEKRRLNLAAVLLHNPKLLLLDELLIGQDKDSAHNWMSFLKTYASQGNSVLLVNHHADLTSVYCDRIIFLEAGRKMIDAPVKAAFESLSDLGYEAFLPANRKESVLA